MLRGGNSSGFTIVEVMIFLVVTSALFIVAMNAIQGRQTIVQFQLASREANSKINEIISQVANGFYPNDDAVTCTTSGPSGSLVLSPGLPSSKGTSTGCVFLGKVIRFTPSSSFSVVSVAGRRYVYDPINPLNNTNSSTLAEALPTPIVPSGTLTANITEQLSLQNGLEFTCVGPPNVSNRCQDVNNGGSIALLTTFPNRITADTFVSGSQHVSVGTLPTSNLNEAESATLASITNLKNTTFDAVFDKPEGVVVCIASDDHKQRAKIIIGGTNGGGGQLAATLATLQSGDNTCPF